MVQLLIWSLLALSTSPHLHPQRRSELEKCNHTLGVKRSSMESEGRCCTCFMTLPFCICEKIKAIDSSGMDLPEILIYTHYKEYGKTSNSGKLIPQLLPQNSRIVFFHGERSDVCITSSDTTTLVLCPSPDSIPLQDFLAGIPADQKLRLILLDSTWSQSKSLNRNLDKAYSRVNLNAQAVAAGPSLFLNRKQVSAERTSTLETLIHALKVLKVSDKVSDGMYKALKVSVTSVLTQKGLRNNDEYNRNYEKNIV